MNKETYRSILANATFGYAYYKTIFDAKGEPADYEFLEVNVAFERLTGLKAVDVIGKTVYEVIPGIKESAFDFTSHYDYVALNGGEKEFEQHFEPLNRWYKVQAFSTQKGYLTTIFADISFQFKLAAIAQQLLTYTSDSINYQLIIDTACEIAGAEFAALNIFDEKGHEFCSVAFSGMSQQLQMAIQKLGIDIPGQKWEYHPAHHNRGNNQKTWRLSKVSMLTSNVIPPEKVDAIATELNINPAAVVKIEKQGRMLGYLTFVFISGQQIKNQTVIETYADMIGMLLDRLNQERENNREFAKFKQITSQISDIVWRVDLNFNNTYISPSIERIMGFSVDEYLSIPPQSRYTPQTLQKLQLLLSEELEKEKQQDIDKNRTIIIEVEHFNADSTIVPLELHVSFLRDENGTPVGLQGISRDITERKAFEEDIEYQNKFRKLLIEIASGFINTPLENVDLSIQRALEELGKFVDADRSYTFYYDWEKDVCNNIHEWCADGITPEIDNLQNVPLSMMQDWVVAHKKGESMFISDLFLLPPGNVREILEPQGVKSLLAVPMNINGSCIGFVGFDSVRRHHTYSSADHQLLQVFAQVLANLRMRKLLEQNLIAAKDKAEESSRLKTAFINNISHEIRTPLNGILGFGGLMMDVAMPYDDKLHVYNLLQASTSRLIQTITDIMDISELNTGTIVPKITFVHIANAINNQVEKIASSCTKKKINLSVKIPDKYQDMTLQTDEELFIKILYQLLSNSIKFTNEGEITIGFDADDKNVCFFVKDTGKGISADKLEIIFEPFTQEDGLNTRVYEGNGLGLPLAKGMVELLGGKIWVESEIGKGSTFFFEIPF
jgi:PAS domain S-box-containing protein